MNSPRRTVHRNKRFAEYVSEKFAKDYHPAITASIAANELAPTTSYIIYGPEGSGKYSVALSLLQHWSPSKLATEKNIPFQDDKIEYIVRASDVHFEVNMSLLRNNYKTLWREIYEQVCDIYSSTFYSSTAAFILCKEFQECKPDLMNQILSHAYVAYMRNSGQGQSRGQRNKFPQYIFLTTAYSSLPSEIKQMSTLIRVPTPTEGCTSSIILRKYTQPVRRTIQCIRDILREADATGVIVNQLLHLREILYDVFAYNVNVYDYVWGLTSEIAKAYPTIPGDQIIEYGDNYLKEYNNYYRQIYHLERFVLQVCLHIQLAIRRQTAVAAV